MSRPNFKPWRFVGQGILIDEDDNEIVLGNVYSDDQTGWLIAAAPDLYEALRTCRSELQNHKRLEMGGNDTAVLEALSEAEAAIAKAEGR